MITTSRWTHVALTYHPQKAAKPCIRKWREYSIRSYTPHYAPFPGLFIDGVLSDTLNLVYPRPQATAQIGTYIVGDDTPKPGMSWCLASAHLLSIPLGIVNF